MQRPKLSKPLKNDAWVTDFLFLALTMGLLFFLMLGSRPLFTPDEGRYAEIAREMVVRGDYITPTLNGIKYFEKPALFYWLGAAAIKLGGSSVFALRCINAMIAILGCLATYAVGRKLYGRTAGLLASIILGTNTLYFVMAHMISLDLPVTVLLAVSLYGFILAALEKNPAISRNYLLSAAAASALAVLTKGLIGAIFPAIIAAAWLTLLDEWRQLKRLPVFSALLVFLLIAAPWHILVNQYNPEFFHFYFIEQHFLRYTTKEVGHYQPMWFFLPTLIAGFFPWIVFLPQALVASVPRTWQQRRQYASELFFIIWAIVIFVFFSFSKSKLIPYILPVMPALAILTGRYLASFAKTASRGLVAGYICLLFCVIGITCYLWNISITVSNPVYATLYLRASLAPFVIGAALSLFMVSQKPRIALYITIISTSLFLVISHGAVRYIDTRTIQPLTVTLAKQLAPGDEVMTYNQYYQDLPFYLQRRITILNWRNELTYGMQHQDTQAWMIDDNQFWKRWHSHRVYMIMSTQEYQRFHQRYPNEKILIINETPTNVLVTNSQLAISPS